MTVNDLRKGRWSEAGREYLVTMVTHRRKPAFVDLLCARLLVGELRRLSNEGNCEWLAWMLMPDHFHGLARLGSQSSLSAVIRLLKGRSARRIQQARGDRGRFWQTGYHDRALRRQEDRRAVARYIVANPLRAGLVERIGDYPHWDCVWLE